MAYKRTVNELRQKASVFWPTDLSRKAFEQSVIPLLLETQEQFIAFLTLPVPDIDTLLEFVERSTFPPNLFLNRNSKCNSWRKMTCSSTVVLTPSPGLQSRQKLADRPLICQMRPARASFGLPRCPFRPSTQSCQCRNRWLRVSRQGVLPVLPP
jgi:hypothetical protein